jgi:pterin-4a-carbinolamine dehydratase
MSSIKETKIKEYIKNIDFTSEWSVSKISSDMRSFLGEEPGIDVKYKKDVEINEHTGKANVIRDIDSLDIVFYDIDNKFKKVTFKIGRV